ncbi:MAG: hypothetical protein ABSF08_00655 [Candidatus Cybelea sp.]
MAQTTAVARHADRGKSWMLPEAAQIKKLLYVSDAATDDVFVYNYVSGEEVGKLTGFDDPGAQCVDTKGNVYIATASGLVAYSHAGQFIRNGGFAPTTGCAFHGNRIHPLREESGVNYIYKDGSGFICIGNPHRKFATCDGQAACYTMWPGGFYATGSPYVVEGETDGVVSICATKPANMSSRPRLVGDPLVTLSFDGTIYAPGSVMWDGEYLALTDEEAGGADQTGIYQATLSRTTLTSHGETILSDPCDSGLTDVVQPFIVGAKNTPQNKMQGTVVVGGNAFCPGTFDYWKYPAGGDPIMTLPSAPQEPVGQSVSIAP